MTSKDFGTSAQGSALVNFRRAFLGIEGGAVAGTQGGAS